MLSRKFLFTLVGLLVAVFAVCQTNFGGNTVEGWWGGIQRTWKTVPVIKPKKGCGYYAAGGNFLGPLGDDAFVKRPQFQGLLSPRFTNADLGANIRYNPADYQHQASACHPLAFGDMAQENYKGPSEEGFQAHENYPSASAGCSSGSCGGGCGPSCGKGGMPVPPYHGGSPMMPGGYASGNFNQLNSKLASQSDYPDAVDALPVGTMTTIDAMGNVTEPVVYQQFMFANQKSRLRSQGDPIRGDLPIVPCEGNWFSVHPNVNLDLQEGAMNVMGGTSNDTNRALSQLINDASGDTTVGGVNLADVNMTPQYQGVQSAGLRDISVAGYP